MTWARDRRPSGQLGRSALFRLAVKLAAVCSDRMDKPSTPTLAGPCALSSHPPRSRSVREPRPTTRTLVIVPFEECGERRSLWNRHDGLECQRRPVRVMTIGHARHSSLSMSSECSLLQRLPFRVVGRSRQCATISSMSSRFSFHTRSRTLLLVQ